MASGGDPWAADALKQLRLDLSYKPEPIWGCEDPALAPGAYHVVIATVAPEPAQLLPWIWHLGLTNAHVYVYHRLATGDPRLAAARKALGGLVLPCGMRLYLEQLLPNKGREAATYLHHIVRHYERPPEALMLLHDHGPAARHSLCGPFFRRARAYYIGIAKQMGLKAKEGTSSRVQLLEDGGAAGGGSGGGSGRVNVFERFANMSVSLSSGCKEVWLKGCCGVMVCSEDVDKCPFHTSRCIANADLYDTRPPRKATGRRGGGGGIGSRWGRGNGSAADPTGLGPGRWLYLHGGGGLYDSRYENLLVGGPFGNTGFGPLTLVRYTGPGVLEANRQQASTTRSLDYPEGEPKRTREETFQQLQAVFARHKVDRRKFRGFKSCCASLLLRPNHVRYWPLDLYRDMLAYTLDAANTYHATLAISHHAWALWAGKEVGPADLMAYYEIDVKLNTMRGCPAWVTMGP